MEICDENLKDTKTNEFLLGETLLVKFLLSPARFFFILLSIVAITGGIFFFYKNKKTVRPAKPPVVVIEEETISSLDVSPYSKTKEMSIKRRAIASVSDANQEESTDFNLKKVVPSEKKSSHFYLDPKVQDVTGAGKVRVTNVGGEVGVKISDQSKLGVSASTELPDPKDAAAWNRASEKEDTATVKYKLKF